jgi:Acetyl/propionyl-CoA carboxylase, alpha subunit
MKKYLFKIDNEPYQVEIQEIANGSAKVAVNGEVVTISIQQQDAPASALVETPVSPPSAPHEAEVPIVNEAPPKAAPGSVKAKVTAPLPGIIGSIKVKVGDKVKFGDVVLVLEAMKMENNINATASGTIVDIRCNPGVAVKEGDVLMLIGE